MSVLPWLREVPAKWWAVLVGVAFGSVALITINGAREGYGRAALTAVGIAPLLCLLAGALLPSGTSLEIAALVGGVTALGGTALVLTLAKKAPTIIGAAVGAAARSYLEIEPQPDGKRVTRRRVNGVPDDPSPELEALAKKFDVE